MSRLRAFRQRLAALEAQPPSADQVRAACAAYHATGRLPESPILRDRIVRFAEAMRAEDPTDPHADKARLAESE